MELSLEGNAFDVLGIPEIAERLVRCLPHGDLAAFRSTCRTWRAASRRRWIERTCLVFGRWEDCLEAAASDEGIQETLVGLVRRVSLGLVSPADDGFEAPFWRALEPLDSVRTVKWERRRVFEARERERSGRWARSGFVHEARNYDLEADLRVLRGAIRAAFALRDAEAKETLLAGVKRLGYLEANAAVEAALDARDEAWLERFFSLGTGVVPPREYYCTEFHLGLMHAIEREVGEGWWSIAERRCFWVRRAARRDDSALLRRVTVNTRVGWLAEEAKTLARAGATRCATSHLERVFEAGKLDQEFPTDKDVESPAAAYLSFLLETHGGSALLHRLRWEERGMLPKSLAKVYRAQSKRLAWVMLHCLRHRSSPAVEEAMEVLQKTGWFQWCDDPRVGNDVFNADFLDDLVRGAIGSDAEAARRAFRRTALVLDWLLAHCPGMLKTDSHDREPTRDAVRRAIKAGVPVDRELALGAMLPNSNDAAWNECRHAVRTLLNNGRHDAVALLTRRNADARKGLSLLPDDFSSTQWFVEARSYLELATANLSEANDAAEACLRGLVVCGIERPRYKAHRAGVALEFLDLWTGSGRREPYVVESLLPAWIELSVEEGDADALERLLRRHVVDGRAEKDLEFWVEKHQRALVRADGRVARVLESRFPGLAKGEIETWDAYVSDDETEEMPPVSRANLELLFPEDESWGERHTRRLRALLDRLPKGDATEETLGRYFDATARRLEDEKNLTRKALGETTTRELLPSKFESMKVLSDPGADPSCFEAVRSALRPPERETAFLERYGLCVFCSGGWIDYTDDCEFVDWGHWSHWQRHLDHADPASLGGPHRPRHDPYVSRLVSSLLTIRDTDFCGEDFPPHELRRFLRWYEETQGSLFTEREARLLVRRLVVLGDAASLELARPLWRQHFSWASSVDDLFLVFLGLKEAPEGTGPVP